MTDNISSDSLLSLYLHIPFCEKKCAYCDFYSSFLNEELMDTYVTRLIQTIKQWGGTLNRPINTIYLGGGTPSLLGKRIIPVIEAVKKNFTVKINAEITVELNPSRNIESFLTYAKNAGVNRLSIGAQSGSDVELCLLGRTHTVSDTENAVNTARKLGFDNISLDLMLGLPNSSDNTLKKSLDFITRLNPEHISAYILKIEENTFFYHNRNSLNLPDDDSQAEQYLFMCDYLKNKGYSHYEISNFCKKGMESQHNLKYWNDCEYLGIGPAAHSFLNGKRFYYPRDIKAFLNGNSPVSDGEGGSKEEYFMLKLRLSEGISISGYENKFEEKLPGALYKKCELYKNAGLLNYDKTGFSLTDSGMIVSNSIISELMECIE